MSHDHLRCAKSRHKRDDDPPSRTPVPVPPARILLVGGSKDVQRSLRGSLTRLGCTVRQVATGERALHQLETSCPDVLFADLHAPDIDGMEFVRRAKRLSPDLHVVVMTDDGAVETGDRTLKDGADDFLPRPFRRDQLRVILDRVFEQDAEHHRRRASADAPGPLPGLVGSSPPMEAIYRTVRRVAPSDETVLIVGESGTGKELAARAIHFWSRRHRKPFVSVNCAALTDTILENELFGHEPQSFTGATGRAIGLIEQANGGTLLLDEIADASPALQTSLLRVLQENEIRRVGATKAIPVNIRLITATNRDLEREIDRGCFRRDLYYRLSVVPIRMPPLRERPGDLPLLIDHFLDLCDASDRSFDAKAIAALQRYPWPGNVRELYNLVRRLRVLVLDTVIQLEHLPPRYREATDRRCLLAGSFREAKEIFERHYMETLLERAGGNIAEAARAAGLGRPHLHGKLRKFGIDPGLFRRNGRAAPTA